MTDREDISVVAAEFVLGTLDASERDSIVQRRAREPALDAAIRDWEQRLSPLTETARPVLPPPDMLARIERQLGLPPAATATVVRADTIPAAPVPAPASAHPQAPPLQPPGPKMPPPGAIPDASIINLGKRLARWRKAALASTLLAACLALAIGLRETVLKPDPARYVAVFQKDDASPAFLMTVDLAKRELTVRMVAADAPAGKSYQLWIATEQLGKNPRSLGLIEKGEFTVQRAMLVRDGDVLKGATFGVSLEPEGGSPTGLPTGPVFHSRLIRLTP